ncbi:helix-turn-helix domain-containing protein [Eubacteriales bacterium OttesenSCG-928-A19]|nr:helix-turn-helix domain-containing protein [Eubacteriales bacterium OttesenSCG-928-A19]
MMKKVLTVSEMAKELRISRPKGYELAARKDFPTIRVGKRILIPTDALDRWLADEAAKTDK